MKSLFLILLFFFFGANQSVAQNSYNLSLPQDSSVVEVRTPDEGALQAYANDSDFNYDVEVAQSSSFWEKILFWLVNLVDKAYQNQISGSIIRIIFTLIFISVVVLLINQLIKGNLGTAFSGKKSSKKISLNLRTEHIDQINLDELIDQAIKQKNYHDALRFTYHKALQKLSENELILWATDKTNHEYLSEIGNHPVKLPFNRLTTIYDYVEYGDFEIDERSFEKASDVYLQFEDKLRSSQ